MTMKANSIVLTDGNGTEIYLTDVDYYVSEYIDTLPDAEMIYKPKCFIGMLDYLYEHVIRNVPYKNQVNGQMLEYDLLGELFFKVYKPLCSRYNMTPTVIGFATFLRISNTNLSEVKQGYYHSSGRAVNPTATETIQKIYDACMSATLSNVVDGNSVGSIFAMKACYGYSENPQPQLEVRRDDPLPPIEDVEQRYLTPPKIE